ncbi:hypothetical protein HJG60_007777 [Phyllostomus discolor]|uniref:Uncharacterized protein n=1 Tax=Phyllostomus discolor TaxID=89673 RepID=A0A834BKV3_9CHIR|nr:hypothetical protein HJG60_007777 [Phyllostomus discolor]
MHVLQNHAEEIELHFYFHFSQEHSRSTCRMTLFLQGRCWPVRWQWVNYPASHALGSSSVFGDRVKKWHSHLPDNGEAPALAVPAASASPGLHEMERLQTQLKCHLTSESPVEVFTAGHASAARTTGGDIMSGQKV